MMLFFFSLIPATFLVILGYFTLYASSKAEGAVRPFGKFLSTWVFVLAALVVLGGALGPSLGLGSHMANRHMSMNSTQGMNNMQGMQKMGQMHQAPSDKMDHNNKSLMPNRADPSE